MQDITRIENVQIIDAKGEIVDPTPRKNIRVELHNHKEIRREMARIYKEVRTGKMETADATRLIYILRETSNVLKEERAQEPIPENKIEVCWTMGIASYSDAELKEELARRESLHLVEQEQHTENLEK